MKKYKKAFIFVPFVSSFVIAFATMYNFKKCRASLRYWLSFCLAFFSIGIALSAIVTYIPYPQYWLIQFLIAYGLLTAGNLFYIFLQEKAASVEKRKEQLLILKRKGPGIRVIIILGIFLALVIAVVFFVASTPSVHYDDINGTSKHSLGIITIDDVLTTTNHYSAKHVKSSTDGISTDVEGLLEKYDYDRVTFSSQEVHGIRTLQATKTTCNTMILDVDSTVTCGNAELFIFVDDAYYQSIDINQVVSVQLEDITGKTVVVKIAAESAELNVFLKRTLIE